PPTLSLHDALPILIHARAQAVLGQVLREHSADHRHLVGVVDLIAAEPPADPGPGHTLRVTNGNALVLEGKIARRRGSAVEVLMEPHVRRHNQRAYFPIISLGCIALGPHQGEALAREDDDVRAGTVSMALLIGTNR